MIADHDSAMVQEVFAAFAEHGTWYVPTHLTRWSDAYADDARLREDPLLEYLHPLMKWQWLEDIDATVADDPVARGPARRTARSTARGSSSQARLTGQGCPSSSGPTTSSQAPTCTGSWSISWPLGSRRPRRFGRRP